MRDKNEIFNFENVKTCKGAIEAANLSVDIALSQLTDTVRLVFELKRLRLIIREFTFCVYQSDCRMLLNMLEQVAMSSRHKDAREYMKQLLLSIKAVVNYEKEKINVK